MHAAIEKFPRHIEQAMKIGGRITLKKTYTGIRNIVIAGMGGSAIGGDVVRVLSGSYIPVPIVVSRHYNLPSWVGPESLVICSSYSGNTEETLSAYAAAKAQNAQICGISTGGELTRQMLADGNDMVTIPGGLQPRAALAFSFVPMLYLLREIGIFSHEFEANLKETVRLIKARTDDLAGKAESNPARELAELIYQTLPILYAETESLNVAAVRFKGQLCENSKMLAYVNELPEMNHNEIVGWENNRDNLRRCSVIWLKDPADHPRVRARQAISEEILDKLSIRQFQISGTGETTFVRFLSLINFTDWVSYWCAILHETDPTPVEKINELKERLAALK